MTTETYIYVTETAEGRAYESGIGRDAYDGYDYEAEVLVKSDE